MNQRIRFIRYLSSRRRGKHKSKVEADENVGIPAVPKFHDPGSPAFSAPRKKAEPKPELSINFWTCKSTWKRSAKNTWGCLVGCSIGDFGTILAFQAFVPDFGMTNPSFVMIFATCNGLLTSFGLETWILTKQMYLKDAMRIAGEMSLVSMIVMEMAMNITDFCLTGGASLTFSAVLPCLLAGYFTPLPINYYRLKKYGKACH